MQELVETFDGWRSANVRVGRAVVIRTFGSTPRPGGAVLLVTDDGQIAGSVSGGCVEGAAAEEVLAARKDGRQRVIRYGISDEQAWDVGLACGGTIDVLVSPAVPAAAVAAARDARDGRGRGQAVVTRLPADAPSEVPGPHTPGPGDTPSDPLTVDADGRLTGTLGEPHADEALVEAARACLLAGVSRTIEIAGLQLFVEAFPARPRLVVVGAVEIAPQPRPSRAGAWLRDGASSTAELPLPPGRGSPTRTGSCWTGRRRRRTRSDSGLPTRSPS